MIEINGLNIFLGKFPFIILRRAVRRAFQRSTTTALHLIIIINISYFKCSSMNHTSRGSKETLALLKLRTYAFNLIKWTNGGMKINWSNDPPPGIEPVTTGMVSAPPNH